MCVSIVYYMRYIYIYVYTCIYIYIYLYGLHAMRACGLDFWTQEASKMGLDELKKVVSTASGLNRGFDPFPPCLFLPQAITWLFL